MNRLEWLDKDNIGNDLLIDDELVDMYHQLRAESMCKYMEAAKLFYVLNNPFFTLSLYLKEVILMTRLQQEGKTLADMAALLARRVNVLT